ncbi:iojap-like ribosome-associated protein [Chitinispirillum alkaliphilum]|nr:iojap-like ribosome-associated protein [Chitinispirillum alkaliphilum]
MNKPTSLAGENLVNETISSLQQKLAEKITVIDLTKIAGPTDWFIICEADNTSHTRAIADEVVKNLKAQHTRPWHEEGTEEGRWILIDYTDVVIHIMLPELREYYNLESLWKEGVFREIPSQQE